MKIRFLLLRAGLALVPAMLSGCNAPDASSGPSGTVPPELASRADSVAFDVLNALGGQEAWASLRYLRFDFGSEREGERRPPRKHLWDRHAGDYRLEWQNAGGDTTFVALFNVDTRQGRAYVNGAAPDTARSGALVRQAYRSFINDSYWLLAPVKLLDPGVRRTFVADSSSDSSQVIQLRFGEVGLTPGDTYWIYVDPRTNRVDRWAYVLQGNPQAPPSYYRWTDYRELSTPAGPVYLASRKEAVGEPRAVLTDALEAPASVPPEAFTDPNPRL